MLTQIDMITQTQSWIEHMVIGQNLCPFAKPVWLKKTLHYAVLDTAEAEELVLGILRECERLDENKAIETTLILAPKYTDFLDFLDMADIATECMHRKGYEGIYQLASFHPDYQFEGTEKSDLENYTNRSPFPTFHILREHSLEKAIDTYGDTDTIPERNIATLDALGKDEIKAIYTRIVRAGVAS